MDSRNLEARTRRLNRPITASLLSALHECFALHSLLNPLFLLFIRQAFCFSLFFIPSPLSHSNSSKSKAFNEVQLKQPINYSIKYFLDKKSILDFITFVLWDHGNIIFNFNFNFIFWVQTFDIIFFVFSFGKRHSWMKNLKKWSVWFTFFPTVHPILPQLHWPNVIWSKLLKMMIKCLPYIFFCQTWYFFADMNVSFI